MSLVRSVEQSSTTMISVSTPMVRKGTARTCCSSVPMKRSSLYAGMTIDSVGMPRQRDAQVRFHTREFFRCVHADGLDVFRRREW